MCDGYVVTDQILTRFKEDGISSAIWMLPNEWEKEHASIRNTVQYIMLKIKLYLEFEDFEDGVAMIFKELMKFSTEDHCHFPFMRFNFLLNMLTSDTKKALLKKMEITHGASKFQVKHIRD